MPRMVESLVGKRHYVKIKELGSTEEPAMENADCVTEGEKELEYNSQT